MFNDGGLQQAASRVFNQKWLSDCGPKQSKLRRASAPAELKKLRSARRVKAERHELLRS
jgi:hypothetical protein